MPVTLAGCFIATVICMMLTLAATAAQLLYACVQVDLRSTWTVVSSVILAFAFAFQNSVRHLFESVIFLFFIHPCANPCILMCRSACWLHVLALIHILFGHTSELAQTKLALVS